MINFLIMQNAKGRRILVVRVGAIGDTLMATPLVRHLATADASAEVDFLCSRLAFPLLELNPCISQVFALRSRNWPLSLSPEKLGLVRRLRARAYDFAVLLESAPRYRALLEHAGLGDIRSFVETPFDSALHAVVNNLRAGGIPSARPEDLHMDLCLGKSDMAVADRLLEGLAAPRIGIHIGWGPQGRKRNQSQRLRGWDLSGFVHVIRRLAGCGASILLTGSQEDARDAAKILRQTGGSRVRSIAGRTSLRELAAVLKNLDLLISVDSGPCHMAAAFATPMVVLWGPGRLQQTRPLSAAAVQVIYHPPACAPCQSTPLQKSCTRNICMESIAPEEVLAEAARLLPALNIA